MSIATPDKVREVLGKDRPLEDLRGDLIKTLEGANDDFIEFLLRTKMLKVGPQFIQFVNSVQLFLPPDIELVKPNGTRQFTITGVGVRDDIRHDVTIYGRAYYFVPESSRVVGIRDNDLHILGKDKALSNIKGFSIEAIAKLVGEEDAKYKSGEMSLEAQRQLRKLKQYPDPRKEIFELILSKIDELIEGKDIPEEAKVLRQQVADRIGGYHQGQELLEKEEELGRQVKKSFWNYAEGLGRKLRLPRKVIVPYGQQDWEIPIVDTDLEKQNSRYVILPREKEIMKVPFERRRLVYDKTEQASDRLYLHLGDRIQRSLEQSL